MGGAQRLFIPSIEHGVPDAEGSYGAVVASDGFPVGDVPAEGDCAGEVGGLGSQPKMPLTDPDAERFAAVMLPDKTFGKLPIMGDHECHAVGGDSTSPAIVLPGESAVAIG